ncbi:C2H2-type zinc finger protein [Phanerochaete sordida]|uniref:C2H2-type zinc finger protein n=1 Tax=Phanerochaete sordida TaxID=48140 RepID=A0A9P3FYX8_9APHY|nr:C2H2-type zinc finger protein [Phanerochaete sordida]
MSDSQRSDSQRKLPGPRQLFPHLFRDDKAAAPAPPSPAPAPPAPSPIRPQSPLQAAPHGRRAPPLSSEGQAGSSLPPLKLRPAIWPSPVPGPLSPVDKKRYVCEVCEKRFERPSSLETHMNSHTGLRPHNCVVHGCPKSFSTKSNMQRHLRTHHA